MYHMKYMYYMYILHVLDWDNCNNSIVLHSLLCLKQNSLPFKYTSPMQQ